MEQVRAELESSALPHLWWWPRTVHSSEIRLRVTTPSTLRPSRGQWFRYTVTLGRSPIPGVHFQSNCLNIGMYRQFL